MGHENEPRPSWSQAPDGWNWLAQDADGRWFWYAVEPQLGLAGGVWRPYMHSESLEDQQRCTELFSDLPGSQSAKWSTHHRQIIERFGRFPHRNRLLGRATTAQEQAWLDEGGFQG